MTSSSKKVYVFNRSDKNLGAFNLLLNTKCRAIKGNKLYLEFFPNPKSMECSSEYPEPELFASKIKERGKYGNPLLCVVELKEF